MFQFQLMLVCCDNIDSIITVGQLLSKSCQKYHVRGLAVCWKRNHGYS